MDTTLHEWSEDLLNDPRHIRLLFLQKINPQWRTWMWDTGIGLNEYQWYGLSESYEAAAKKANRGNDFGVIGPYVMDVNPSKPTWIPPVSYGLDVNNRLFRHD